jgi:MFS family permease
MGNDRASLSVRRLSSVDVSEASTDGRIRGVWRTPSVLGIALAEVLSSVGTEMTWLALPWFVLTTTHSPARMGIVFAVEVAPTAILGIPAGSIVDRYGARRTMLVCDLARAPLLASFPMLHDAGLLSFPVLLALVAVIGVFTTPYLACQRLILPEVVGEDEARVAQANTVVEGARNGAGLVGPAVAGVLIASIGALNVLWIDAASYAVSFLIVLAFVRVVHRVRDDEGAADGMLAGLRYALADPMLRSLAVVSCSPDSGRRRCSRRCRCSRSIGTARTRGLRDCSSRRCRRACSPAPSCPIARSRRSSPPASPASRSSGSRRVLRS